MGSLGETLLHLMGGEENITNITYCATRLRPTFKDKDIVNVTEIKNTEGVVGVVDDTNRFQIVIGTNVGDIYEEIMQASNLERKQKLDINIEEDIHSNGEKQKNRWFNDFISFVVSIFSPLLPLFAGSGLLRGFTILAIEIGWLSEGSSTDVILTVAGTAVFEYLSILVAITTAKRLKASPYIAAAVMGALLMPEFTSLMGDMPGTTVSFMGLPISVFSYSGQVIPAIIAVWIQSKIEHLMKNKLPSSLHLVVIPTVLLFIMVPLTAGVIGPIGNYISIFVANLVEVITSWNSILTGAIIGGIWNILIMFGVHWAPNTTIIIPQIALTGSSPLIAYGANANLGMAGAALAVFIKSKDKKLKSFSITSITSVLLSGIVEPAIYGIGIPLKTPLIAGCIGAALGGAFMGAFNVIGYAFVFGGLTTIPAFAGPTLWAYIIGLLISFVSGFILTLLFGFKESEGIENDEK